MKVELKNVKIHPDVSQETNCFSATIYVDGQRAGTVQNSGTGGSHQYWWKDKELSKQLQAHAEALPTEFNFDKLDQLIDGLLKQTEILNQLKKWTKRQTVFRLKEDKKGDWRTVNARYNDKVKAWLLQKYGAQIECVVNVDPEAAVAFNE